MGLLVKETTGFHSQGCRSDRTPRGHPIRRLVTIKGGPWPTICLSSRARPSIFPVIPTEGPRGPSGGIPSYRRVLSIHPVSCFGGSLDSAVGRPPSG